MTNEDQDQDVMPFANRAWNQTSIKSCSQQLYWLMNGYEPKTVRPNRFISIDRRNRGSCLHDAARLALHMLFEKGRWPAAAKTIMAVIKSGGGRDVQGDELSFMKGDGYHGMIDVIGELVPKVELFMEKFKFNADDRIGSEHFVAIDQAGDIANFFEVPNGGYHGRIDWAEMSAKTSAFPNQLKVLDFKNRPAIHPEAELRSHEQLSFYVWMLSKHYPQVLKQKVIIGIYYFEYGVQNEIELTWEDVEKNVERLMIRKRHKAGLKIADIIPEPGFGRCQYCEYIGDCPEGTRVTEDVQGAIVDKETAEKAAKSLFVLDELRDAIKDALKQYCEEFGPVSISDDSGYGFVTNNDYHRDLKAIEKVLKDAGIDPYSVMRIDMLSLNKATKGNKELDEKIKAHVTIARTGSLFKSFKPTNEKVILTPKITGKVKKSSKNNPDEKEPKPKKKKSDEIVVVPLIKRRKINE